MSNKVVTAEQAAALINDNSTIVWTTAGLCGFPEEVAIAIEKRFLESGHPKNITATHSCGCGSGETRGTNHFAHEGLLKRLIAGHIGQALKVGQLITENKIQAYLLPQGVLAQLWRQIAGKKPGVVTKIGIGTFVDPRLDGGKATSLTEEELVKVIEIENEEWLLYKSFPIDVAIIRGTTVDEKGNLTMEKEAVVLEALSMAQAAKNCGGIVIAQAERLARADTLDPRTVKVPGNMIDYIVIAEPENHMQTIGTQYNPSFSGEIKIPLEGIPALPLNERKVIARRAAMELIPNTIINLGIGLAAGVSFIAAEEGASDLITLTTELGTYGGVPASGPDFAAAYNPEALIAHETQFDFYDGGGLDASFVGLAQVDKEGNINVSKFGPKVVGTGGFVNITQTAKKVVFCGTFTNGAKLEVKDGEIKITKESNMRKFVNNVEQVTFSGKYAQANNQPVIYVTERAVFSLEKEGLTLIEIAPGLDLEKDILSAMDFKPRISPTLKTMPPEIFRENWGALRSFIEAKSSE